MNLAQPSLSEAYNKVKQDFSDNKSYLRKVIMVAEDDVHDGWSKLTDIEITLYLWALYYHKYKKENIASFRARFKNDLYTSIEDDKQCWNQIAKLQDKPQGLYTFSANEIRNWNRLHHQKSIIDNVDGNRANDYWFDTAIKTSFK